jgi:hypothetical protein
MAIKGQVKVVDKGWNAIVKEMKAIAKGGGLVAAVGIQGPDATSDHGGITNAELGAIHEYGSQDGRIPERSHFRSTLAEEESSVTKGLKAVANEVYSGKGPESELLMVGEDFRAKVLQKIRSGLEPDIAESTRAARGEGPPLWVTGQYINSIITEVTTLKEKQEN